MLKNKSTHFVITFVTMFAVQGALAANATPTPKQVVADYTRPLSFEPNRGQADKRVEFLAHGTGYALFLSHAEAVMVMWNGTAVRMSAVGGTISTPEAVEQQPSRSNYFIGNIPERWHTSVANYSKVRYRSVYPGVDLIYYGNQRQLEYDFVVNAGADPYRISLDFQGAAKATLDRYGDIVMHTAVGDLRWHKPVAYQEVNGSRKLIACSYVRKGGQLGFNLAAYDRTKPLIIDPVLEYSTYLGGDGGTGIAVDAHGNAYVVGGTISTDFPTKNAFQKKLGSGCCSNAFITKFDTKGKLVYSTYLGGSGFVGADDTIEGDNANGIAVDAHGNAYVTGSAGSLDFPLKNAFQTENYNSSTSSCLPCFTAFVTKLDSAGSALVFSTYLGGHGSFSGDGGSGIAVDAHENAYVTGFTDSSDFPTKDAFQGTLEGGLGSRNAFVTKFDPTGRALVYSTYLGGNSGGNGIAVDRKGNAYITGTTSSPDFPTKNAFQDKPKSNQNGFVTKFAATGNELVYSTYLGGSGVDQANSIAIDAAGHAYVTGSTDSIDFPIKNAFQKKLNSLNNPNAFVTKFDAAGNSLLYSTYLGGSIQNPPGDGGTGIAVDAHGNAFITGFTTSTDFPTKNAFQNALAGAAGCGLFPCGNPDAFVTEIDAAGCALVYSTYLGGSNADAGSGIALDQHGNAYVVGSTFSTDFPIKDAFQKIGGAFVTKISAQ